MEDVLDVDQVPSLQSKIDAHPQELLGQHGHVKTVAVEALQIASMEPLEQPWGDATERQASATSSSYTSCTKLLSGIGISGLTKMRCSLPSFRLFDHRAVGHQFDHGHLHDAVHPNFGPRRLEVKNTNGRFKCSFFTNSIMSFRACELTLNGAVEVEPFQSGHATHKACQACRPPRGGRSCG